MFIVKDIAALVCWCVAKCLIRIYTDFLQHIRACWLLPLCLHVLVAVHGCLWCIVYGIEFVLIPAVQEILNKHFHVVSARGTWVKVLVFFYFFLNLCKFNFSAHLAPTYFSHTTADWVVKGVFAQMKNILRFLSHTYGRAKFNRAAHA